jgi:hypothetical protein
MQISNNQLQNDHPFNLGSLGNEVLEFCRRYKICNNHQSLMDKNISQADNLFLNKVLIAASDHYIRAVPKICYDLKNYKM